MAVKTDKCVECLREFILAKLRFSLVDGTYKYMCVDCRKKAKESEK